MACKAPVPSDTDTDPPWEHDWAWWIGPGAPNNSEARIGTGIAVLDRGPPLVLGISQPSYFDADHAFVTSVARILAVTDDEGGVDTWSHSATDERSEHLLVGFDMTGDGAFDVAASGDPAEILVGPLGPDHQVAARMPGPPRAYGQPRPCRAGGERDFDLCLGTGIDLTPVDGVLEADWTTDASKVWRLLGVIPNSPFDTLVLSYDNCVSLERPGSGDCDEWQTSVVFVPGSVRGQVVAGEHPRVGLTTRAGASAVMDGGVLFCTTDASRPGTHSVVFVEGPDGPVRTVLERDLPCDALEVADFDGDGEPEVAVGGGDAVEIYEPADWTLVARHLGDPATHPDGLGTALASLQYDDDGRADLLVGAPWAGRVYLTTEVIP